jgi:hypothetical protein
MKILLVIFAVISLSILASCDVQSGIARKGVEKYIPTPTPSISPTPTEVPIDPADVLQVDTSVQGPLISINEKQKRSTVCDKYNRVMVNSSDNVVTIKRACSQVTINGDRNDVTVEAATEIVFNGSENKVRYSRYANGKRPLITDNKTGNLTEKTSAVAKN